MLYASQKCNLHGQWMLAPMRGSSHLSTAQLQCFVLEGAQSNRHTWQACNMYTFGGKPLQDHGADCHASNPQNFSSTNWATEQSDRDALLKSQNMAWQSDHTGLQIVTHSRHAKTMMDTHWAEVWAHSLHLHVWCQLITKRLASQHGIMESNGNPPKKRPVAERPTIHKKCSARPAMRQVMDIPVLCHRPITPSSTSPSHCSTSTHCKHAPQ